MEQKGPPTLVIPKGNEIWHVEHKNFRYKMDSVALQETRWLLAGKLTTKDYIIYYSGNAEGRYQRGVGFEVSNEVASVELNI